MIKSLGRPVAIGGLVSVLVYVAVMAATIVQLKESAADGTRHVPLWFMPLSRAVRDDDTVRMQVLPGGYLLILLPMLVFGGISWQRRRQRLKLQIGQ
jgi:hypothetical protein